MEEMSFIRTGSHYNQDISIKNSNFVISQKNIDYQLYAYYQNSDKKLYFEVIDFTLMTTVEEVILNNTTYNFSQLSPQYTRSIDFHECQDWNNPTTTTYTTNDTTTNYISVPFGYIHHNGEDYVAFATTGLETSTGQGMRCVNVLGKYYILRSVGDLTSFTDALTGSNIGAIPFVNSNAITSHNFQPHSGFVKVVDIYIPKIGDTPYVLLMVFYEDKYVLNLFFFQVNSS